MLVLTSRLRLPEFTRVATEWKSMIIAREPLTISDPYTVDIVYRADGEDEALENAQTYKVRIITPTTLAVGDFVNYLCATNTGPEFVQKAEVIQGLNALFGHSPQSRGNITSIGQNRHFLTDHSANNQRNIQILGGGLESLRGYYQSLRPATGGLLLNINVTHGVFLEPVRLDYLYPKLGSGNKVTLQKKLKLVRVEITHLPAKKNKKTGGNIPRVKTIFGLAHPQDGRSEAHPPQIPLQGASSSQVKFWLSTIPPAATAAGGKAPAKKPSDQPLPSNTYISVFDYFRKKYPQIKLNGDLPVVNVGNRDHPSFLPAEVCTVLPGQTIKRRLSPEQTQKMITFACRKPWENAESIINDGKAVLGLAQTSVSPLGHFGLQVGASLITVAARVLPPPAIKYKSLQNKETALTPRFGSWNMADIKFHTGSNLRSWTYILFQSSRGNNTDPGYVNHTVRSFAAFLNKAGVNASGFITSVPPPTVLLRDGDELTNDKVIKDIFRKMHLAPANRPNFVLCVLPYPDVAVYNSIKSVADTKAGIHTVCVVAQKFLKEQRQDQYFGNVSLKFNLKAGGINQTLDAPKMGIVGEGKTMVVGIDVTHPSPGSKEGAPSAAGIVASVDKFLGQWPCTFSIQEGRKETVSALEAMFASRLVVWEKFNKQLPENIIIYRDGVSEGQYQILLDVELPLVRAACSKKYPATATKQGFPKISIIVCGKRHHTRFYPTQEGEADRSSNCGPGTIVDRGVTEVRGWDFFLQPHACLQGTARSCHYYVVLDEVFRGRQLKPPHVNHADALEELTNNMCHLFGRATKAVSLCPPAYYADLLCTRLRCYLADQFDPNDTSASASVASGATSQSDSGVTIPPQLVDSMFYI